MESYSANAARASNHAFKPPADPVLRATWLVGRTTDLTEQERRALLVMWRVLRGERKPFGPRLLAYLISTSYARAKNILTSLKRKRYIGCEGRRSAGRGHAGIRWLTNKIQWPKTETRPSRGGSPERASSGIAKRAPGSATDCKSDKATAASADASPSPIDAQRAPTVNLAESLRAHGIIREHPDAGAPNGEAGA